MSPVPTTGFPPCSARRVTTAALAKSPAAWPPMPSATAKRGAWAMKLSSLTSRRRPVSVLAAHASVISVPSGSETRCRALPLPICVTCEACCLVGSSIVVSGREDLDDRIVPEVEHDARDDDDRFAGSQSSPPAARRSQRRAVGRSKIGRHRRVPSTRSSRCVAETNPPRDSTATSSDSAPPAARRCGLGRRPISSGTVTARTGPPVMRTRGTAETSAAAVIDDLGRAWNACTRARSVRQARARWSGGRRRIAAERLGTTARHHDRVGVDPGSPEQNRVGVDRRRRFARPRLIVVGMAVCRREQRIGVPRRCHHLHRGGGLGSRSRRPLHRRRTQARPRVPHDFASAERLERRPGAGEV